MPTFTTKIYLQSADETTQHQLSAALERRSFEANRQQQKFVMTFIRSSNSILEVNNEVAKVVSQLGKPFSFTIMRNKN